MLHTRKDFFQKSGITGQFSLYSGFKPGAKGMVWFLENQRIEQAPFIFLLNKKYNG